MRLDLAGARALRVPDPARLARLDAVEVVVVVGSSCAGKTTLVDAVRASAARRAGRVDVPVRYVTRPRRAGDSTAENVHVSVEEFEDLARAGRIAIRWARTLDGGRTVHYGFAPPRPAALPVYSANNAIYDPAARLDPPGVLARALLVGVYAPDDLRASRLRRRSPDLPPEEAAHRLADPAASILRHAHVVVENHGALEPLAPEELVGLVDHLALRGQAPGVQ